MTPLRQRAAVGLGLLLASTSLAVFACVGDDPVVTQSADAGSGGDASQVGQGGDLAIELVPELPESLPGGDIKVHVKVVPAAPLDGPVKVTLSPGATGNAASPLTIDKTQLDLPRDLPEGDVVVSVDASSRHGRFPINVVATATAAGGAAMRGEKVIPVRVVGRPGQLDTELGDGKGYFDFCPFPAGAACQPGDLHVYPDGRVLVVGSSYEASKGNRFLAARFMPDGTLDPSFGNAGVVTHDTGPASPVRGELAPLPDGSFVVAFTGASYLAFARMKANGEIDTTWGQNGVVDTQLRSGDSTHGRVVSTPTGFLLAGGYMLPSQSFVGAVEAYNADGGRDSTFGDAGAMTFSTSATTQANSMFVDPAANGRVVVGGEDHSGNPNGARAILVALTATGRPDPEFGDPLGFQCGSLMKGCVVLDTPGTNQAGVHGVVKHKNGYLAIVGYAGASPLKPTIRMAHLNARGSFDAFRTIDVDAGGDGWPGAFVVQPDDAFLVANGYYAQTFFILRYDSTGKLDPSFGTNGLAEPVDGFVRRMGFVEDARELFVIGIESKVTTGVIRMARYWLR